MKHERRRSVELGPIGRVRLILLLLAPFSCAGPVGSVAGDDCVGAPGIKPRASDRMSDVPGFGPTRSDSDAAAGPLPNGRGSDPRPGAADAQARRITPVVQAFQKVSPAVVNLSTTSIVTVRDSFGLGGLFDDIFDFPGTRRPRRYERHSVGSGFLIHADGYVVTNAHVVDRASECKVILADGTELPAEEVAIDRKNDLAVLKVEAPQSLPSLRLGTSGDLMPGETVIAIGNPFGYQHTVTTGIISALNRELAFGKRITYTGLIQTDAPINPGNSGGPLLNILGELVGITTAIRGDAQNIGFAIPVDHLHARLPVMLDIERLRRVEFGVRFDGQPVPGGPAGVRVQRVEPGSPAAQVGVRPGDIVTAIDGKPTPTFIDAFGVLRRTPVGRPLRFELHRQGSRRETVTIALAEASPPDGAQLMWARFGMRVRELAQADLRRLRLRRPIGLLVVEVSRRSQAFGEGVAPGDLVTAFGGHPVVRLDMLGLLSEQVSPGDVIPVGIWRVGEDTIIQVELALKAQ